MHLHHRATLGAASVAASLQLTGEINSLTPPFTFDLETCRVHLRPTLARVLFPLFLHVI